MQKCWCGLNATKTFRHVKSVISHGSAGTKERPVPLYYETETVGYTCDLHGAYK